MTNAVVNILPYSTKSASAKAIARSLGLKLVIPDAGKSKYKSSEQKLIINWGTSRVAEHVVGSRILNPFDKVRLASNKLSFFQTVRPDEERDDTFPRTPDWTTDKNVAISWLEGGFSVFARTKLNGHSGEGIVDVQTHDDLTPIKNGTLFVKYIPKKQEWRIHLMRNLETGEYDPFLAQRKARKTPENEGMEEMSLEVLENGFEAAPAPRRADEPNAEDFHIPTNWRVRNLVGGFIFTRNEGNRPHSDIIAQATKAIKKIGLDFGAVDVIFQEKSSKAFVLEINTAPGLVNSTLEDYTKAIRKNFLNKE